MEQNNNNNNVHMDAEAFENLRQQLAAAQAAIVNLQQQLAATQEENTYLREQHEEDVEDSTDNQEGSIVSKEKMKNFTGFLSTRELESLGYSEWLLRNCAGTS
jgi:regulator of replication initiation timing